MDIFPLTTFLVSVSKIRVLVRRQGEVNIETFEVNYSPDLFLSPLQEVTLLLFFIMMFETLKS